MANSVDPDQPRYSCRCDFRVLLIEGKGLSVKPARTFGTLANSAIPDQTRHLIRVSIVYLNYRKLRVNGNSLKFPLRTFSQPTLRDNRPAIAFIALILYS